MNRFFFVALLASFALKHYVTKMLEKNFKRALDKEIAEQNAPAN